MTQYKSSMSIITESNKLAVKNINLDDFWQGKPLDFSVTDRTKIISFVHKITHAIDPLAFLQKFSHPGDLHFYWENPSKQEAVAACGVTKSASDRSNARFTVAQDFLKNCFRQIKREGDRTSPLGKPSIFCSFSFFPFSQKSHVFSAATIFLPRFQIVKKNKSSILIVNYPLSENQQEQKLIKVIKEFISGIDWASLETVTLSSDRGLLSIGNDRAKNSNYFKSVVASALESIALEEFSKIVLAHTTDIKSPAPFRIVESLDNLRKLHPDCYIFSIGNGRGQNFIGASPERLVSIQNKQLVTDALAGSAPRGKTPNEDLHLANLLLKNRKEKREHQAVSDFIMQRLRSLGLKPQQLPLQLLRLSNIQHLWTPIYAHLPADIEPLEIVAQLHPTPAVAGVPTETACEKIRHYEKFDRSLYAAPLGWVDDRGNSEFIVGIRSALIDGDCARLYAGAGIVSGSNPAKEFAEVQLKLESLLEALV